MAGASTREVAIRHSLVRLKLLAGGERQATIMNFAVAFLIMMITRNLLGILAAVAIAAVIQSIWFYWQNGIHKLLPLFRATRSTNIFMAMRQRSMQNQV